MLFTQSQRPPSHNKVKELMKTTLYLTLTLITFVTLAFVPGSFAQDDSPEYVVRTIYFLPNDREPQPDIDTKLDTLMKDAQQLYADVMESHGFDRKTFQLETDENSKVIVHHVNGESNDTYYHNGTFSKVIDELSPKFDTSNNIYFVAIDISSEKFDVDRPNSHICGISGGKWAATPASGVCFNYRVIAHELGHNFGLSHDKINYSYIEAMIDSLCSAEWLDVQPYFNEESQTNFIEPTTVNMLTPSRAPSSNAVRFSFEVRDPDGLHQAQLYIPFLDSVVACKRLNSQSTIVEFDTTYVASDLNSVGLKVIDVDGNHTYHHFQIDISEFLLPPKKVTIPDATLAAAIRAYTRLPPNADITTDTMVRLTRLFRISDDLITDITGLEHATNLISLSLSHPNSLSSHPDEITDFSALSGLRELRSLGLARLGISDLSDLSVLSTSTKLQTLYLQNNAIKDISVLAGLTNLEILELWNNNINNITPIAGLTNLTYLDLNGNQISDITPLRGLTNLTYLSLSSNRISDITPLTELTNLTYLSLSSNRISDITLLTKLTKLRKLFLVGIRISDITLISELTNLRELALVSAEISDITPLAKLHNLERLQLQDNRISDVSPLIELVNLKELYLMDNPIKNRKPLLALLRKNPDIKIYLKNSREPLPVTLSHFRAEHTEAGVLLKWTTESEVDNAGFYIYRSKTKNGEFKVVNPTLIQGAGTTGERNEYSWTDTTAKPNTVYYYRIEDVSHAGVREQLATVRLRGLISAKGKLTTRWADLKAER